MIGGKALVDETTIRENATKVSTVSEQQIRDLNALDLPSALRRVPGVTISRYNLVGSYGGFEGGSAYIRGQGAERPGGFVRFYADDGAIGWEQWSAATNNWFNTNTDWLNSGLKIQQSVLLSPATELTLGFDYGGYGGKVHEQHADPVNDKRLPEEKFSNTAG